VELAPTPSASKFWWEVQSPPLLSSLVSFHWFSRNQSCTGFPYVFIFATKNIPRGEAPGIVMLGNRSFSLRGGASFSCGRWHLSRWHLSRSMGKQSRKSKKMPCACSLQGKVSLFILQLNVAHLPQFQRSRAITPLPRLRGRLRDCYKIQVLRLRRRLRDCRKIVSNALLRPS